MSRRNRKVNKDNKRQNKDNFLKNFSKNISKAQNPNQPQNSNTYTTDNEKPKYDKIEKIYVEEEIKVVEKVDNVGKQKVDLAKKGTKAGVVNTSLRNLNTRRKSTLDSYENDYNSYNRYNNSYTNYANYKKQEELKKLKELRKAVFDQEQRVEKPKQAPRKRSFQETLFLNYIEKPEEEKPKKSYSLSFFRLMGTNKPGKINFVKSQWNPDSTKDDINKSIKRSVTDLEKTIIIFLILFSSIVVSAFLTVQIKTVATTDIKSLEIMRDGELRSEIIAVANKNQDYKNTIESLDEKIAAYKEATKESKEAPKILEKELLQSEKNLGYTSEKGPGIEIILKDNDKAKIDSTDLLLLVNQLWAAGAQAISINDQRIVSTTEITAVNQTRINVNSKLLVSPYVVKAIGNKQNLESALLTKDGYINQMLANNKNVQSIVKDNVEIPKYTGEIKIKYAK